MKRHCYSKFVMIAALIMFVAVANQAHAVLLTKYDPVGYACPVNDDLAPATVDASLTASVLHNNGPNQGCNTTVWPVRAGVGPLNLAGYYIEFTLTPANPGDLIQLSSIKYDWLSYQVSTFTVSLMTSADGFSSVVDSKSLVSPGYTRGLMTFDASSVPATAGPLTIRFYLHDLVSSLDWFGPCDWADIVSTAYDAASEALSVYGVVAGPVATEPSTWGKVKALYR